MNENDELYTFEEEELETVLGRFVASGQDLLPWKGVSLQEACTTYRRLFPPKDGLFHISIAHIKQLERAFFNETIMHLINEGMLDFIWDDNEKDFAYKITPRGMQYYQDHYGS